MVNANIKAQVTGYLLKQGYTEGALVKQGQLMIPFAYATFYAIPIMIVTMLTTRCRSSPVWVVAVAFYVLGFCAGR
jgi:hypothetical protein